MENKTLTWTSITALLIILISTGTYLYLQPQSFEIKLSDGEVLAKYKDGIFKSYVDDKLAFTDSIQPFYYNGDSYVTMYKARGTKYENLSYTQYGDVTYIKQIIHYSKGNLTRYFKLYNGEIKEGFFWEPIDKTTKVYFKWNYEGLDSISNKKIYSPEDYCDINLNKGIASDWCVEKNNIVRVEQFTNGKLTVRTKVYQGDMTFDPTLILPAQAKVDSIHTPPPIMEVYSEETYNDKKSYFLIKNIKQNKIKEDVTINSELLGAYTENGTLFFELQMDKDYEVWVNCSTGAMYDEDIYINNGINYLIGFSNYENCSISSFELHIGKESDVYAIDLTQIPTSGQSYIYASNMAQYSEAGKVASDNFVAWWELNGNANDELGRYNGTEVNTTNTTDRFGNTNGAYGFNGINSYVESSNVSYQNELTVSAWVKISKLSTNFYDNVVFSSFNLGSTNGVILRCGDGKFNYRIGIATDAVAYSGNTNIGINTWTHLVLVLNKTTAKSYVNGILDTQNSNNFLFNNSEPKYIGTQIELIARTFNGSIDDVRIFNKSLSSTEVLALYNEKAYRLVNNGLVGCWLLHGDAIDCTGTSNGIIYGAINTTDRYNNNDNSLSFDGINDYVNTTSKFNINNPFTMSLWAKLNSTTGITYTKGLLSNRFGSSTDGMYLGIYDTKAYFAINGTGVSSIFYNNSLSINTWYNIVGAYDGAKMSLYVNGVLAQEGAKVASSSSTNSFLIGNYESSPGDYINRFFNGSINDVFIYNRTLSAGEILALYKATNKTVLSNYTIGSVSQVMCIKDCIPNPTNIIAQYALDGNTNDYYGKYNGTPNNVTYASGRYDNAIALNGINSYTTFGTNMNSYFQPNNTFSISSFVKVVPGSTTKTILSNTQIVPPYNGISLSLTNTSAIVVDLSQGAGFSLIRVQTISTALNDRAWHYIAVTYNGSMKASGVKVYIDGVLNPVSILYDSLSIPEVSTTPLYLGMRTGIQYFNGTIDNVIFFNKELSSQEVFDLYLSGYPVYNESININRMEFESGNTGECSLFDGVPPYTTYNATYGLFDNWTGYYSNSTTLSFTEYNSGEYISNNYKYGICTVYGTYINYFNITFSAGAVNANEILCPAMSEVTFNPSLSYYNPVTKYLIQNNIYPDNNSECGYTYNITATASGTLGALLESTDSRFKIKVNNTEIGESLTALTYSVTAGESFLYNVTLDVNATLTAMTQGFDYNLTFQVI